MFLIRSDAQPSEASGSVSPELAAAASAAAASLPDPSRAESELLQQLRQHEAVPLDHKRGEANNIGYVGVENPFYIYILYIHTHVPTLKRTHSCSQYRYKMSK